MSSKEDEMRQQIRQELAEKEREKKKKQEMEVRFFEERMRYSTTNPRYAR
jgi:hypothetical protein